MHRIALILTAMIVLAATQIVLRNLFDSGIIWGDAALRVAVLWVGLGICSLELIRWKYTKVKKVKCKEGINKVWAQGNGQIRFHFSTLGVALASLVRPGLASLGVKSKECKR